MTNLNVFCLFFFFKQKTAYEMRISDWSSDVCSSDLLLDFFIYFGIDAFAVRPVETRSGGALLQFFRAKQGRQSMRHAGQCALVCVTLAFIGLDVFPAWEIFAFSEDVRMPDRKSVV